MAEHARRVLVVDDDSGIRASISEALAEEGLDVRLAAHAEEALALFGHEEPDLVLTDVRMPGMDGLELLRLLRERAPAVDVVLMTAYDDMPTVVTAMREGAFDFLVKPLDLRDLRRVLKRVFADRGTRERARKAAEKDPAPYALDQLIGRDPRMIEIYKTVGKVAANRASVLIRGESGTGKELIARAIHYNSPDAEEPFVPVNCTALPATLLESELFGHVKGSFTGATSNRRGRFALAGRGTIFLDEIGDTTPEFQAKLLRVLEDREFYPVGAERPEHTGARVIAATHRKLEKLIESGGFRADLYYRLHVVEITLPPLRERLGDLPLLAEHLARRAADAVGARPPVISPEALDALLRRSWPGNVRELENCLTRAVVLASGSVVRAEHLEQPHGAPDAAPAELVTLAELERRHIEQVLAATRGHKAKAASILGVSRPRLNRLLERHGFSHDASEV